MGIRDLKKMAQNGYGHHLRREIPKTMKDIQEWQQELLEMRQRIMRVDDIVKVSKERLKEYERDLRVIDEKYTDIEPDWS